MVGSGVDSPSSVFRVSVLGAALGTAAEGVLQTRCGGDLVGSEVLEEGFRRLVCTGFYSSSLHPETAVVKNKYS